MGHTITNLHWRIHCQLNLKNSKEIDLLSQNQEVTVFSFKVAHIKCDDDPIFSISRERDH